MDTTQKTRTRTPTPNEIALSVKVDKELAQAFRLLAKSNNRTQSALIRDFMACYVKKNGKMRLY